jgi:hypothetical protein
MFRRRKVVQIGSQSKDSEPAPTLSAVLPRSGRRRPKGALGMHMTKRSAAALAGVVAALAIAVPIADAGAATTPGTYPGFSFYEVPRFVVDPPVGSVAVAIGPTVINDVFNGATVVQSVNGAAYSSVIGSPDLRRAPGRRDESVRKRGNTQ